MTYGMFRHMVDELFNFTTAKNKISYKLVNYEANTSWLYQVPHRKFLDLAVVYQVISSISPKGIHTILIDNGQAEAWNVTETDLHKIAKENTPKSLPLHILGIDDVIRQLENLCEIPENEKGEIWEELGTLKAPMYVITNRYQNLGAACILYDNVLQNFSKEQGCDLFILPSSIHEMMVILDNGKVTAYELKQMIREVNDTLDASARTLFLSNNVYMYKLHSGIQLA